MTTNSIRNTINCIPSLVNSPCLLHVTNVLFGLSGRKYAIRTDVMYSSKVIRSHKDNESSTKEMTSQDIQNQLEELEEERCKPS
jgi:hypothetical protein